VVLGLVFGLSSFVVSFFSYFFQFWFFFFFLLLSFIILFFFVLVFDLFICMLIIGVDRFLVLSTLSFFSACFPTHELYIVVFWFVCFD